MVVLSLVMLLSVASVPNIADSSRLGDESGETATSHHDDPHRSGNRVPTQDLLVIPAGPFVPPGDPLSARRPVTTIHLPSFAMHRLEVTNAAFLQFVDITGYQTLAERDGDPFTWRTAFETGMEGHPVVFIAFQDAEAFCGHFGLRLPTLFEWEKAAGGTSALLWPWGNTWDLHKTNSLERAAGGTRPVGADPAGASPYGMLDMAGNAWEWTASEFSAIEGGGSLVTDSSDPFNGHRILKGGSWRTMAAGTQVTYRKPAPEEYRRDTTGFRCASDRDVRGERAGRRPPLAKLIGTSLDPQRAVAGRWAGWGT
jgi:gamma-glutamyl hercynylcysteine S-oxide synthase